MTGPRRARQPRGTAGAGSGPRRHRRVPPHARARRACPRAAQAPQRLERTARRARAISWRHPRALTRTRRAWRGTVRRGGGDHASATASDSGKWRGPSYPPRRRAAPGGFEKRTPSPTKVPPAQARPAAGPPATLCAHYLIVNPITNTSEKAPHDLSSHPSRARVCHCR